MEKPSLDKNKKLKEILGLIWLMFFKEKDKRYSKKEVIQF